MNVLSWINEINSSRLVSAGWSWNLSGGWIFFSKHQIGSTWRNSWDTQEKNLGGSRLVTSGHVFFFVFLLPLNTFRVYLKNHGPCPPKKVIRIIEIVTLCFCSRNSQEGGTLLKPFPFFFTRISQKSRRPFKRIVPMELLSLQKNRSIIGSLMTSRDFVWWLMSTWRLLDP